MTTSKVKFKSDSKYPAITIYYTISHSVKDSTARVKRRRKNGSKTIWHGDPCRVCRALRVLCDTPNRCQARK